MTAVTLDFFTVYFYRSAAADLNTSCLFFLSPSVWQTTAELYGPRTGKLPSKRGRVPTTGRCNALF